MVLSYVVGRFVASFCIGHVWAGRGWTHLKKYTLSYYVACMLLQTLGGQKKYFQFVRGCRLQTWSGSGLDALSHSIENTGTVDFTGVLVELKKYFK